MAEGIEKMTKALFVEKTKLNGVLLINPHDTFSDFRGTYTEIYNEKIYNDAGITDKFIQDDYSLSRKHVLRGIHGDDQTAKLITCLQGEIHVVVVNNDETSPQFHQWQSFRLSESNKLQVYIPAKFGNSFVTLSDTSIFYYKQTTYYDRSRQFTLKWNDPDLKIEWPVDDPILSERDS